MAEVAKCCDSCGKDLGPVTWPDLECSTCGKPLCKNINCRDKHRESCKRR